MSKAHRGKGIREEQNRGRGTCPVCNKTAVKVLYEQEIDGTKKNICKICKAAIKNKKAAEKASAEAAPAEENSAE